MRLLGGWRWATEYREDEQAEDLDSASKRQSLGVQSI